MSQGKPVILSNATVGAQSGVFGPPTAYGASVFNAPLNQFLCEWQSPTPEPIVFSCSAICSSSGTLITSGQVHLRGGGIFASASDNAGAALTILSPLAVLPAGFATEEPRAGIFLQYGAGTTQNTSCWFDLRTQSIQLPPCTSARASVYAGSSLNGGTPWGGFNIAVSGSFDKEVQTGLARPILTDARKLDATCAWMRGLLPGQTYDLDLAGWVLDAAGNARTPKFATQGEPVLFRDYVNKVFLPSGPALVTGEFPNTSGPAGVAFSFERSTSFAVTNLGATTENIVAIASLAL